MHSVGPRNYRALCACVCVVRRVVCRVYRVYRVRRVHRVRRVRRVGRVLCVTSICAQLYESSASLCTGKNGHNTKMMICQMHEFILSNSLGVHSMAPAGECARAVESLISTSNDRYSCSPHVQLCLAFRFQGSSAVSALDRSHECARGAAVHTRFPAGRRGGAPSHSMALDLTLYRWVPSQKGSAFFAPVPPTLPPRQTPGSLLEELGKRTPLHLGARPSRLVETPLPQNIFSFLNKKETRLGPID